MALRAEQLVMIGVVGLGAYALYRLSRAPSGAQTPVQAPPDGSSANLPDAPGAVAPPPGLLFATGPDPNAPAAAMHVANSRAYRGRGEDLTPEDVSFLDAVRFYRTPAEARAGGVPEWAIAGASKRTRWFYGRYLGADADYARPARINFMWTVGSPPARTAGYPGGLPAYVYHARTWPPAAFRPRFF